jgi:hypothetical protein
MYLRTQSVGFWKTTAYLESPVKVVFPTVSRSMLSWRCTAHDTTESYTHSNTEIISWRCTDQDTTESYTHSNTEIISWRCTAHDTTESYTSTDEDIVGKG